MSQACEIDPNNPQLRFQRVHVLLSMKNEEEALRELEIVRDLAPTEAPVYTLLGQIYQRMGRVNDALKSFSAAVDLDPKGEGASMKAALEGYHDEQNLSDEEEEAYEEEDECEDEESRELNRSYGQVDLEDEGVGFEADGDFSDDLIVDPDADQWGRSFDSDERAEGFDYNVEDEELARTL